jgi:hypothetical protein
MSDAPSHEEIAAHMRKELDWPQYYVTGESEEAADFVPAYYKVEGPNGPVAYLNPNSGPFPTTMFDFAMEMRADDARGIQKEHTPWKDYNDE